MSELAIKLTKGYLHKSLNWSERVRAPAVGVAHAGGERSGHY
jgi:hypothetical protein